VLTTVDRDIYKKATQLEDDMAALTSRHLGITLAIFVITTVFLVVFSVCFNTGFVHPLSRLVGLIARAESRGYQEAVGESVGVWTRELQAALSNFKRLLVALRFGNAAYHKGDRLKEL
jgi:hypothetical protein